MNPVSSARVSRLHLIFAFFLIAVPMLSAQAPEAGPIAIITFAGKNPDAAAKVTGALEVSQGKAVIAVSGAVTSGSETTDVVLPHRGVLRVCASTTVKLAADSSVPPGEIPGLMMAMEKGAIEMSFAANFARGRNSDILLTPDFRILIGGPGAAEVKVRLGQNGDTCVDNPGVPSDRSSSQGWNPGSDAPYVLVSSVFDGGAYRVQPGQRVIFQHGSLHEVVDQAKEPCGCPPAVTRGNEFPLAQSEGLAPLNPPAPGPGVAHGDPAQTTESLVYNSSDHAAQSVAVTSPASALGPVEGKDANPAQKTPVAKKKQGFLGSVGRFFRRIFGAE